MINESSIESYLVYLDQKQANENISNLCVRQRHRDIAQEISNFLGDL